jgi:hypothetical protein
MRFQSAEADKWKVGCVSSLFSRSEVGVLRELGR